MGTGHRFVGPDLVSVSDRGDCRPANKTPHRCAGNRHGERVQPYFGRQHFCSRRRSWNPISTGRGWVRRLPHDLAKLGSLVGGRSGHFRPSLHGVPNGRRDHGRCGQLSSFPRQDGSAPDDGVGARTDLRRKLAISRLLDRKQTGGGLCSTCYEYRRDQRGAHHCTAPFTVTRFPATDAATDTRSAKTTSHYTPMAFPS